MADNTPTNVTPTPASSPAATPTSGTLAPVRQGLGGFLVGLSLLLFTLSAFYFGNARALGSTEEAVAETWAEGFRTREVAPVAIWSALFGAVALGLGYVLLTGLNRPERDTPAWVGQQLALALGIGAVALLFVPIYLFWIGTRSFQGTVTPMFLWSVLSFLVLLTGAVLLVADGANQTEQRLRTYILGFGLSFGAITLVLGKALATITFWPELSKGLDKWYEHPTVLLWPVTAYILGLKIAFLSTQAATPLVRLDQNIRRVVFGANLTVTILLLLLVLALPNALAWAAPFNSFFGRSFDWTESRYHSLSSRTKNFLAAHNEPVKVLVILPSGHPITQDVLNMLDNCRSLNSKITYELIDPRSRATADQRRNLMAKYNLQDPVGLLLLAGSEDKEQHSFIKAQDMFETDQSGRRGGDQQYTFKGEGPFLNALLTLSEGTVRIYFTSGHGELSLEGGMPMMPGKMPRGGGDLSSLRGKLTERESVKMESLPIDRKTKEIPKDASVVVVARPRQPFSKEEVAVFRDYLRRERKTRKEKVEGKGGLEREVEEVTTGRLILLLEPILQKEGRKTTATPTGLEGLLAEYGVKVGENRILCANRRIPEDVAAIADDESRNPIAQVFTRGGVQTNFLLRSPQSVTPTAKAPRGGGPSVEVILEVPGIAQSPQVIWAESDFDLDAQAKVARLRKDRAFLEKTVSLEPLPVAVAISDSTAPPGMPPDAAHAAARKETPRMVVVGAASWITDEGLGGEQGPNRIALFNSFVTWLNAKTAAVGTLDEEKKERKRYVHNVTPAAQSQLYWVPGLLLSVAVLIVGTGVWVVRRR